MSTNYYGKRILTADEKIQIVNAVINDKPLDIPSIHIHIGKNSAGWQFLFNHHNWEYFNTLAELVSFLKKYTIYDQYDTKIDFEDFWEMVRSSRNEGISKENIFRFGLRFSESTEFF